MRHDRRVLLLALLAGAPAVVATAWLAPRAGLAPLARGWLLGIVAFVWIVAALVTRVQVVRPLQTLANVLAALREGDFSFRARCTRPTCSPRCCARSGCARWRAPHCCAA